METKHQAMILAAGRGTRMRPYTSETPKPLVKVAGKPLIHYAIQTLRNAGITKTVVNTHYMAEKITDYLKQRTEEFTISYEKDLLETGGGVCKAMPLLDETFFTLNSDVICVEESGQSVLKTMNQTWRPEEMDGLMLLCPLERAVGYKGKGDFSLSDTGQIQRRVEGKPAYVYMGIQKLHRRFLNGAPQGAFSLSQLYHSEVDKNSQCRLFGMVHSGSWLHVGDPEGVALAEDYLAVEAI